MVFLTLPLIVKHIDVAEFGIWNMLTIVGAILVAFAIMGMDSAVVRFYYEDESPARRNVVFSNGFYIQLAIAIVTIAVAFVMPGLFLRPVGITDNYRIPMYFLLCWVPANVIVMYLQNWFKWTFQRMRFLTIALGTAGFNLVGLAAHGAYRGLNLESVLIIQACASWIFVLVGLWWCRSNIVVVVDRQLIRKLLQFGFPMMLVMMASILAPALDRIFLVRILSAEQLGLYSFCQKLSVIMMVVVTAFQTAFGPFSYSIWEQMDARETFSRFHTYYILGAGVVAIGICCFGKPLILLFGTPDYLQSGVYLPFLVMGALVYGLYSFAALGFFYSRRMLLNLLALCAGLATNLVINILLVPRYGEYGAVVGFLAGNIALVIVGYLYSRPLYSVPYAGIRDSLLATITFVLLLISGEISLNPNTYMDAVLKALLLSCVYLSVALLLLRAADKAAIRRFFLALKNG
jgi:O-antigen/teichoic acid export membrane protein